MTFTPKSEGRISGAVRTVEHQVVNPRGRRRRSRGRWNGLRRFELTENLTFDSNATAYLLKWTGEAYEAQSDVSFEVYDAFSKFNQNDKPTGQDGARGYAQWCWDRRIWEIVQLEHQSRWIKFVVDDGSGFATTDSSVTVDGVTYIDGYEPDTAITTVYNEPASSDYVFEGDDDDKGKAEYDPANDKYWIHQMECP